MIKAMLINYVKKKRQSSLSRFIFFNYGLWNDFVVFLATLTGFIPSHVIRQTLYRHIFGVKIPSNSIIYWKCRFYRPHGVKIGQNSIIGNDAFLDARDPINIGDNVNIGGEVRIFTWEHDITSPSFGVKHSPVYIENWVYIGNRVTILPGVKIGEGSVIASGSVVTKNVDPWTMVGGIPAKFIKIRPMVKYKLDTTHRTFFQ